MNPRPTSKIGLLTMHARELLSLARSTPGTPQSRDLRQGARITVLLQDGQVHMTFSRPDVPVGEPTELATFIAHCEVPYGAERQPAEGQGSGEDGDRARYYVTYVWPDQARLEL